VQLVKDAPQAERAARLFVSAALLGLALLAIRRIGLSDLTQDYAAAWAWWHGRDPNGYVPDLLTACCPTLTPQPYIPHTAHPPVATLVTLPFALLPWPLTQVLWIVLGWTAIVLGWHTGRISLAMCLATIGFWVTALGGTFEPFVFLLLVLMHKNSQQRPLLSGVCLGLSIALRTYPVLLLSGYVLSRHYRLTISALCTAALMMGLAEVMIGAGATAAWLAYLPINARVWVDQVYNISLVRVVRLVVVDAAPMVTAVVLYALLLAPLVPRLVRGDSVRPVLPVMLLSPPLVWSSYVALIAVVPATRIQRLCLSITSMFLVAGIAFPPDDATMLVFNLPVIVGLLLIWWQASTSRTTDPIAR